MDKQLLQAFEKTVGDRKEEILNLQTLYQLKKLENDVNNLLFKQGKEKVLSENTFTAAMAFEEIKVGDIIKDVENEWLMGEEDFAKYCELCVVEYVKDGLTDEDGTYTERGNTEKQLKDIKDRLISISVEILPSWFPNREALVDATQFKGRKSFETRERLFEIIMALG